MVFYGFTRHLIDLFLVLYCSEGFINNTEMAGTNNELDVSTYIALVQSSLQQQPLYDSPQQEMPQYEMVHISKEKSLSSQRVTESKEVVFSNVHH